MDKIYHVQCGVAGDGFNIGSARDKACPAGGELLRAKRARVLRAGEKNTWLEIVLDEGKNRQIGACWKILGSKSFRLIRVAIGPLALGQLAKGKIPRTYAGGKIALDQAVKIGRRNQTRILEM